LAMIDGIRRKLGKTAANDLWDSDHELEPEIEEEAGLATDAAVSVVLAYPSGRYSPDNASTPDYYKSLVQTAIGNGGKHGDHRISVPWLRMILAGLESKRIEPRMMWEGVEPGETEGEAPRGIPTYEDLFQPSPGAS